MPATNEPSEESTHRKHGQGRRQAVRNDQAKPVGAGAAIIIGHGLTLRRVLHQAWGNADSRCPWRTSRGRVVNPRLPLVYLSSVSLRSVDRRAFNHPAWNLHSGDRDQPGSGRCLLSCPDFIGCSLRLLVRSDHGVCPSSMRRHVADHSVGTLALRVQV